MTGVCTACGFEGRLYWGNRAYQLCEGCLTGWVVDAHKKLCTRPTRQELLAGLRMRDGRIDDMQRHLKRLEVRLSALESAAPNCPGGGGLTSEASSLTMEQQIAAALQQYPMMSAPVMARQLGTSAGYVRKVKCQIRKHERNRSLRTQAGLSDKIQAVQGLSGEDPAQTI